MPYLVGFCVAAAATVLVVRTARRRPGPTRRQQLERVILEAFSAEWASRLGCTGDAVRAAVLSRADASLLRRLDTEAGQLDVTFDGSSSKVDTEIVCAYADGTRSTANITLLWDVIPTDVRADLRADLMRAERVTVRRTWRALPVA